MFHPITIVHLFFVAIFAALGLKGLLVHRGKKIGVRFVAGAGAGLYISYSDFVLLFAALSFMSLDDTSLEFVNWWFAQLKGDSKAMSVVVLSAYFTALIYALIYALFGSIAVLLGTAVSFFKAGGAGSRR